ncbi:MAG: cupin domain-containing protein [Planctomycetota bacterium]
MTNDSEIQHPCPILPEDYAVWSSSKMGKSTIFQSDRLLVGLNSFEVGQEHVLHTHPGMDKVYLVVAGEGVFLLEDRQLELVSGQMLVAPADVPHGVRNDGPDPLLVLVFLAPSP